MSKIKGLVLLDYGFLTEILLLTVSKSYNLDLKVSSFFDINFRGFYIYCLYLRKEVGNCSLQAIYKTVV